MPVKPSSNNNVESKQTPVVSVENVEQTTPLRKSNLFGATVLGLAVLLSVVVLLLAPYSLLLMTDGSIKSY